MLTPIHAICFRTVRYSDRNNILTLYTRENGKLGVVIPAGTGKDASRRRALTMPLGMVEGVADVRPGRDLATVRDLRGTMPPLMSVHLDPIKMTVAMFLTELLGVVVPDGDADPLLFDFIAQAIREFDMMEGRAAANFHIAFLYRLSHLIGIAPDPSGYREGMVFDMLEGVYRSTPPLHRHFLIGEDAGAVAMLDRMTWRNLGAFRFSRTTRRRILAGIIDYYGLHYTGLNTLRSMDILREMFD